MNWRLSRGDAQYDVDTKDAAKRIPLVGVESLLDSVPNGATIVCVDLIVGGNSVAFIHSSR